MIREVDNDGIAERAPCPRRSGAILIALISVLMISGGREPVAAAAGGAVDISLPADERPLGEQALVEASLEAANPALSDATRLRISKAVLRYSDQYGLEPDLVTAVIIVESDARPWAYSSKGAIGLMQVMPHMMSPMELAGNMATIESNIEAGCQILSNNIRRLGTDEGISAYFWGSRIRGVAYLEKVIAARERLRGLRTS